MQWQKKKKQCMIPLPIHFTLDRVWGGRGGLRIIRYPKQGRGMGGGGVGLDGSSLQSRKCCLNQMGNFPSVNPQDDAQLFYNGITEHARNAHDARSETVSKNSLKLLHKNAGVLSMGPVIDDT